MANATPLHDPETFLPDRPIRLELCGTALGIATSALVLEICGSLWSTRNSAQFLESIGLPIREEPSAKFALQIQGRTVNQLGIEELVDSGDLEALAPRKHSVQFDGWAVADPAGKSASALAKRFLSDLCESVGRTGYDELLALLPD